MMNKLFMSTMSVVAVGAGMLVAAACAEDKKKDNGDDGIPLSAQTGICDLRETVSGTGKTGLCREHDRSVVGEANWAATCKNEGGYWTAGGEQRCPSSQRIGTCTYLRGQIGQQVSVYYQGGVTTREAAMLKCAEKTTFTPDGGQWAD